MKKEMSCVDVALHQGNKPTDPVGGHSPMPAL